METSVLTNSPTFSLNDKEKLIFNIIFSEQSEFRLDLNKMCTLEDRPKFRDELRTIIKRGGLTIIDDRIIHTDETIFWKIQLKK